MKGTSRFKGKYVTLNSSNPTGLGICDRSGFIFNYSDLVKQMEWRGDSLVWTGLMVGRPFLDVPNEQDRPPLVKDDPRPLLNPRPSVPYNDPNQSPAPSYEQGLANLRTVNFMGGVDV